MHEKEDNILYIDGTIQRFEFVIEMYWKVFKRLLEDEGINASTPRESIKKAYGANWIDNETAWLQMLKDRNDTLHIYNEDKAKQIYNNIKENFSELVNTYEFLISKYGKDL